ncbi:MAG: type II toxin-antitoxin system RelE/ParE family toxin [Bacteroidales bacterium]|jgi:plasmid stabilization system protein ParE|nr:type II toxin-antitoxin system RelE/ParE family toxin [Bacteroidales bacterium]
MELKIIWSDFAEKQLDEIFEYYSQKASLQVAQKLLQTIISEPDKLSENPYIGQIEDMLKFRPIEYRYLVCKNYKIIYSVDEKQGFIKISDVFDTRMNPPKIKRRK